MVFVLRTTFAFFSVNPCGMEAADESRIVLFELCRHDNSSKTAKKIATEAAFFRQQEGQWCSMMVSRAHLVPPAVAEFERVIANGNRRYRQNMATLLAGAFVALHNAVPTPAKAKRWAKDFAATISLHAEELDRDEGRECIEFLFSHSIQSTTFGTYPLGHWIALEAQECDDSNKRDEARRQVATFDMRVCQINPAEKEEGGLYIRNGAPAVDRIFVNTKWAGGAWKRALRKIEGVTAAPPRWFRNGTSRATRIPLDMLPAPLEAAPPAGRSPA